MQDEPASIHVCSSASTSIRRKPVRSMNRMAASATGLSEDNAMRAQTIGTAAGRLLTPPSTFETRFTGPETKRSARIENVSVASLRLGACPGLDPGTRPASARRTASCGNGRGAGQGRASQPTSVGAGIAMPFADTNAMQAHPDEIGRTVARGAHAVLLLDRAGLAHDRQAQGPQQPQPDPAAVTPARARSGPEPLAVHTPELALQPHLRHLRRHRRRRRRGLAKARRKARRHHLNRRPTLGP
jgi:hypothetical protein